jgi:hypothetical protein
MWSEDAKKSVEEALKQFKDEFIKSPYLHRCEHSLHCGLYASLKNQELLSISVPLNDGNYTGLISEVA